MSAPLQIRLLRADEVEAGYTVIDAAFERYLALIGKSIDDAPNPYAYLSEAVPDGRAWAALLDGTLVGVALVDDVSADHWQIDLVGVLEHHAKAGIGRGLMKRVEADARRRGVIKLTLNTLEVAHWLWAFYESLGFRITRRGPPKHGLDAHNRVFMEKRLR